MTYFFKNLTKSKVPYPVQTNQDEANHRRLTHLEDENKQRRATV